MGRGGRSYLIQGIWHSLVKLKAKSIIGNMQTTTLHVILSEGTSQVIKTGSEFKNSGQRALLRAVDALATLDVTNK